MTLLDKIPMNGWKTLIGAFLLFILPQALESLGVEVGEAWITAIGSFVVAIGFGHKLDKARKAPSSPPQTTSPAAGTSGPVAGLLALSALLLAGCGTIPGLGSSGAPTGDAGGAATATNVAQTVGKDQASVPSEANNTGANVNWNFASEPNKGHVDAILALAKEKDWTPEAIESALKALNGAPEVVTITVSGNVSPSSDNTAIGSGTGAGTQAGQDVGNNP